MEAPFESLRASTQNPAEQWDESQEDVLQRIATNSAMMSDHHKLKYLQLISSLRYFRIPTIAVSSINSVCALGLSAWVDQNVVSLVTCLLSLLVSIISSIELFLNVQKHSDLELMSYRVFYLLSLKISTMLKLERSLRPTDGQTFFQQCVSEYENAFQQAQANGLGDLDQLVDFPKTSPGMTSSPLVRTIE